MYIVSSWLWTLRIHCWHFHRQETLWRNGSASDSRSEGCVFESRQGHNFFFFLHHFSPIFFPFCWLPFKCFSDLSSKKYSCCKITSHVSRLLLFLFCSSVCVQSITWWQKGLGMVVMWMMFGGHEVDMGGNAYRQITYSTRSLCCQRQRIGSYIVVSQKSPHGWSSFQAC